MSASVEEALRAAGPQALGALVRRHGLLDRCEDALQEALIEATASWGARGVPEHPRGWLITVASRRLVDAVRADAARVRREGAAAAAEPVAPASDASTALLDDDGTVPEDDDTLALLFLCCHPDLAPPAQLVLTLRAVGGLTTAEIARALLLPEATVAQRVVRAKAKLRGQPFGVPGEPDRGPRLAVVLQVLYLVFTEGHVASAGPDLVRVDLTAEALRLTRMLHAHLPDEGEVAGLLALMLLTDARRATRTDADGALTPLADQDRTRWDAAEIAEGVALITDALSRTRVGAYQLQAAIAAVHAEAPTAEETDWPQVLALYDLLLVVAPNPVAALSRAVAVGMVDGPRAGLLALEDLHATLGDHHRLFAVRAHLLERAGDHRAAATSYAEAARRATSHVERRHLADRAARLG